MNKQEFLAKISDGLSGLLQEEIEERIGFYCEMIDDRVEEGITEDDAVAEIGSADEIVSQIISEIPLSKLVKERVRLKRNLRVWEIVFLVLGSPAWLSLLIAVFAVVLSIYIVLWAVIISLWAVEVSLLACVLGGILSAVVLAFRDNMLTGAAVLGVGLFCAGLAVFMFFGCKAATKGILILTKKIAFGIKSMVIGKESAR